MNQKENGQERNAREYPELIGTWVAPTNSYYLERLDQITRGRAEAVIAQLRSATNPRLRYPLEIIGYQDEKRFSNLPVDPTYYVNTNFTLNSKKDGTNSEYSPVNFGYNIDGDSRRIGSANFLQSDESGVVRRIDFGHELAQKYFQYHLLGREFSPEDRLKVRQIQAQVFHYLRSDSQATESLKKFALSRGWPPGLEDEAYLAYFHNLITPLDKWAEAAGFSNEEMYLAGWFDLNFSNSGKPSFSVRDSHVIRIPYFNSSGNIELWRTRNLKPSRAETHKYTSWPLDRSIEREFRVNEKLYNGWNLEQARGKTLVITEGEFKCLVATHMSGILTVGIPGITEVDETIINGLIEAGAKDYVVILDRDPQGKALMRVDGITDSERASYAIAQQLLQAGASSVGVGRIPDVRAGGKVGIDDLILDKGVEAFRSVIGNAQTPDKYAEAIKLDPLFFSILSLRQRLKKALENYENSSRRGGQKVSEDVYQEAVRMRDDVEGLYGEFLRTRFRGSFRIDQPSTTHNVLFRTNNNAIRVAEKKIAITKDNREIPLERFQDDILFLSYYPSDIPEEYMWIGDKDLRFPFTIREIQEFAHSGKSNSDNFLETFERGLILLGRDDKRKAFTGRNPLYNLGTVLVAGYLSNIFPDNEYDYLADLTFYVNHDTYWEEHVSLPLTVLRKKSSDVVAFASIPVWEEGGDINNAIMLNRRKLRLATAALRQPDNFSLKGKYDQVIDTIWPYWFERKYSDTVASMGALGVSEDVVTRQLLVSFDPNDCLELLEHFVNRQLLSRATAAGLFRFGNDGMIHPRFERKAVFLPVRDNNQDVVALRVLPLSLNDHLPPTLDPDFKLVRHLYGEGMHLVGSFDPERHLYRQEHLPKARNKTLYITYHELDGLILSSAEEKVISLNSSFKLHPEAAVKIRESNPDKICIVISGTIPKSAYDDFSYDGIPGFLKDLYDARLQIQSAVPENNKSLPISVAHLENPLKAYFGEESIDKDRITSLEGSAIDLDGFLESHRFNQQVHNMEKRFLETSGRLLDYLEILALPDILIGRPIEWYARESERLSLAIQKYAQSTYGVSILDAREYFQKKLGLKEPLSLQELIRLRQEEERAFIHRPLYSTENTAVLPYEVPEDFLSTFTSVIHNSSVHILPITNLLDKQVAARPKQVRARNSSVTQESKQIIKKEKLKNEPIEGNPKGEVLEYLQKQGLTNRPEAEISQDKQGFSAVVTLEVAGRILEGTGHGVSKKRAEAFAYAQVRDQIYAPNSQIVENVGLDKTLVVRLQKVLKDISTDNHIGHLFTIIQTATTREPQFETQQGTADEGSFWKTQVSIQLGGKRLVSEECWDESKQTSRQLAARNLIVKIHDFLYGIEPQQKEEIRIE